MIIIIRYALLILSLILPVMASATVPVVRYPSGTPVSVCQPSDTNPSCGGGASGSGNVGIGTSSRIATYIGSNPSTTVGSPTNDTIDSNGNLGVGTASAAQALVVNGNAQFIGAGNVGINSLSPGQALDVQGTVRTTGFQLSTNPSAGYILTSSSVGIGTWMPAPPSSGSSFWVQSPGNIGINTTQNVGIGTITTSGDNLIVVSSLSGGETIGSIANGIGGIDSNTTVMLHFNNNYTDNSSNNFTVTNVNSTFSSSTFKFGAYALALSGSNQYVNLPSDNVWILGGGTGNFTMEFWVYINSLPGAYAYLVSRTNGGNFFQFYLNSTGTVSFQDTGSGTSYTTSSTLSTGTWHHVAVIRGWGGGADVYETTFDGVGAGTQTHSGTTGSYPSQTDIGDDHGDTAHGLNGFIDEFRLSKIARWTTTFTPFSTEYTSVNASPQLTFSLPATGTQTGFISTNGSLSNALQLGQGSTAAITIPSSGNVGIGSTNPGAALDVVGGIRSSTGANGTGATSCLCKTFVGGLCTVIGACT